MKWCREGGSNPHEVASADFESAASASSAIPAFTSGATSPRLAFAGHRLHDHRQSRTAGRWSQADSRAGMNPAIPAPRQPDYLLAGNTRYCSSFPSGSS